VEVKHEKIAGMEGVIGFQSDRSDFLISGAEAFMPPSITQSNSLFFFEDITATEKLSFQFGGRYDHIGDVIRAQRCLRPGDRIGTLTTSAVPSARFTRRMSLLRCLHRSPTRNVRRRRRNFSPTACMATSTFEVGNPNLGVESSLGFDLNLRKRTGWVTGSVGGYYTRYNGFIGLFPTGPSMVTRMAMLISTRRSYRSCGCGVSSAVRWKRPFTCCIHCEGTEPSAAHEPALGVQVPTRCVPGMPAHGHLAAAHPAVPSLQCA
jgi:hypothetical protein